MIKNDLIHITLYVKFYECCLDVRRMNVQIYCFKSHQELNVSLDVGTTLIKGPSGSGKSAIFEAISWCLYGAIRDIDPWTNETAKTKVVITYKDVEICRTKRPANLSVTMKNIKYENPEAQDIIERIFGIKAIWECTGYIDEDASNTLPALTAKQRLGILNILSFPGDNPEEHIRQINEQIVQCKHEYGVAKDIYGAYTVEYDEWWSKNGADIDCIEKDGIPTFTVEELQSSLKDMNSNLIELKAEEAKQHMIITRMKYIDSELIKIDQVLCIQTNIDELEQSLQSALEREKLENALHLTKNVITHTFAEYDLAETVEQERQYSRYIAVIQKYHISVIGGPTQDLDFLQRCEQLRNSVSRANTDFYPLMRRKQELEKMLDKLPPTEPNNHFEDSELLAAREYESVQKYNTQILSQIHKYNLDISRDRMEEIVRNEGRIILVRKKKELKQKLDRLGIVEPPTHTFDHSVLHSTREIEKKRKIIEDNELTEDHFECIEDIRMASYVKKDGLDPSLSFTQEDLENAKKLETYRRVYQINDFDHLIEAVGKTRKYVKYQAHIDAYQRYGEDLFEDEQDLSKLKEEYEQSQHDPDPLTCPHCQQSVFLEGGVLKTLGRVFTEEEKEQLEEDWNVQQAVLVRLKLEESLPFPDTDLLMEYSGYSTHTSYIDNTLVNIRYTSAFIQKQIIFMNNYEQLSEVGKDCYQIGLDRLNQIIKHVEAVGKYCGPPEFTSRYISECIQRQEDYQTYKSIKDEYDALEVDEIDEYVGDISKVRECLKLHNQLKELPDAPKHSSEYIQACIVQEHKYQRYIQIKDEYDAIYVPEGTILSPDELNRMRDELRDLDSVTITAKPKYSSNYIRDSLQKTKILDSLAKYPQTEHSSVLEKKLKNDRATRRQQDAMLILKDQLTTEKNDMIIDDTVYQKVQDLLTDISSYEDELEITKLYDEFKIRADKLNNLYEDVQRCVSKLAKTEELLRVATDTMYQILSSSISDINYHIEKIVSVIFTDPIEIKLNMFKQLKTKNILRPEVSLEIRYRGGVLNNIKHLSKGERSRIVLAVTLALNTLSNIPALLLDETLAHIDQEMKESVTSILKNYATNRSLAIIAHDVISGLYDNVIEF